MAQPATPEPIDAVAAAATTSAPAATHRAAPQVLVPLHRELRRLSIEIMHHCPDVLVDVGQDSGEMTTLREALLRCFRVLQEETDERPSIVGSSDDAGRAAAPPPSNLGNTRIRNFRTTSAFLYTMPPECIRHVISYLPLRDVLSLCLVCFSMKALVNSTSEFWEAALKNTFSMCHFRVASGADTLSPAERGPTDVCPWRYIGVRRAQLHQTWCSTLTEHTDVEVHVSFQGRGVHSLICDRDVLYCGSGLNHEIMAIRLSKGHFLKGVDGNAGMNGHTQSVTSIALATPDLLVSSSLDTTVRVWDRHTFNCNVVFNGHTDKVWCCEAHGDRVFSGGTERSIRIWSISNQLETTSPLMDHRTSISALRLMPGSNGAILVSGSAGNTVRVWDLGNGAPRCITRLRSHQKGVFGLQATPTMLCSSSLDNIVKLWDARDNFRLICELFDHDAAGNPVVSSFQEQDNKVGIVGCYANDTIVITGGPERLVKVYDLRMRRLLAKLGGHEHWVTAIAADDHRIFSGSRDKTTRIWNMDPSQPVRAPDFFSTSRAQLITT